MAKVIHLPRALSVPGADVRKNDVELEIEGDEVFKLLSEQIKEEMLDYIPSELTVTVTECKDEKCDEIVEYEFDINPYEYLTHDDLDKLLILIEENIEHEEH